MAKDYIVGVQLQLNKQSYNKIDSQIKKLSSKWQGAFANKKMKKQFASVNSQLQILIANANKTNQLLKKSTAKKLAKELKKASLVSKKTADNVSKVNTILKKVNATANKASKNFNLMSTYWKVMLAKDLVMRFYTTLKNSSDEMTKISNALKIVSNTQTEVLAKQERLYTLAQDTRSSYSATVSLFKKLSVSNDTLQLSTEQMYEFVEKINQSFASSGISAGEMAGTVLQMGQALSKGVFNGDELRSILENSQDLAVALSRYLKRSVGDIRDLGAEGKITSQVFVDAVEYSRRISENFSGSEKTLDQMETQLSNAYITLVNSAMESAKFKESMIDAGEAMVDFLQQEDTQKALGYLLSFGVTAVDVFKDLAVISRDALNTIGDEIDVIAEQKTIRLKKQLDDVNMSMMNLGVRIMEVEKEASGGGFFSGKELKYLNNEYDKLEKKQTKLQNLLSTTTTSDAPMKKAVMTTNEFSNSLVELNVMSARQAELDAKRAEHLDRINSKSKTASQIAREQKKEIQALNSIYQERITLMERELSLSGGAQAYSAQAKAIVSLESELKNLTEWYAIAQSTSDEAFKTETATKIYEITNAIETQTQALEKAKNVQQELADATAEDAIAKADLLTKYPQEQEAVTELVELRRKITKAEQESVINLPKLIELKRQEAEATNNLANSSNDLMGSLQEMIGGGIADSFMDMFDAIRTGDDVFESITNSIGNLAMSLAEAVAQAYIMKAVMGTMGGIGGSGSLMGGLFGVGMHDGGTIGKDATFVRQLPKHHNGGTIGGGSGLRADERLIVGQVGEEVLSRKAVSNIKKSSNNNSTVQQNIEMPVYINNTVSNSTEVTSEIQEKDGVKALMIEIFSKNKNTFRGIMSNQARAQ